jgi:hypothetical protein
MHQGWTELLIGIAVAFVLLWIVLAIRRAASAREPVPPPARDAFEEVEVQAAALRQQVAQGLISESVCRTRMRELMIQDPRGNWWMVGYESGSWFRHDGEDWVRADPPR